MYKISKTYRNCSSETQEKVRKIIDELEEAGELATRGGSCGYCGATLYGGLHCPNCGAS